MPGPLVVLTFELAALLASSAYYRRWQLDQPPSGAFSGYDVLALLVAVVLMPFAYLALPTAAVVVLAALPALVVLTLVATPVLGRTAAAVPLAAALVAADAGTALRVGTGTQTFRLVNDVLLVLLVVGVTNLWAQSGMRTTHLAWLAAALAAYDLLATTATGLTVHLVGRLSALPFSPLLGWRSGRSVAGIGVGDLLVAALAPLLMHKAFGRQAGRLTLLTVLGVSVALFGLISARLMPPDVPAMAVLGPVIVLTRLCWARRRPERTTWQYLLDEPRRGERLRVPRLRPRSTAPAPTGRSHPRGRVPLPRPGEEVTP